MFSWFCVFIAMPLQLAISRIRSFSHLFKPKKNSRAKEAQELILGRFLAFYGSGLHIHMQLHAIHIQQQPEVMLFMILDLWVTIAFTLKHSREGSQPNSI